MEAGEWKIFRSWQVAHPGRNENTGEPTTMDS